MSKLDLTNKVSPCCKKKIKYHEICPNSHLGFSYYTCSYCEGELTRTQILRANIEEENKIDSNKQIIELQQKIIELQEKIIKLESEK